MRRFAFLLLGAAIGLSAPSARAQPAPSASAGPSAASSANPPQELGYDPSAHAGVPERAWLRMTRGKGRRSTGMMATGIVLVSLGAVFMSTGTAIYAVKPSCNNNTPFLGPGPGTSFTPPCPQGSAHLSGMAILLAGSIGVALGIPLWALGASDVPWAEAAGLHAPASARPTWAAAAPALTGAPGGAGLAWQF